MPDLSTQIHLDMWRSYGKQNRLRARFGRALRALLGHQDIYGMEWGDPEVVPPLGFVRDRYLLPRVKPDQVVVEIGAGGGRWTRYVMGVKKLYVVDYHQELLDELRRNFDAPNMTFIRNNGCDFPGIPENSVDFIFSFGCFVHLEPDLIEKYFHNMARILKPGGDALIHYADKTKIMAQINSVFVDTNPSRMRQMVLEAGFEIVEEDLTSLWHSSVICLKQKEENAVHFDARGKAQLPSAYAQFC